MFTVKDQDPQKKAVASRSKGLDGQAHSEPQMREPVDSLRSLQRNLGNSYLQSINQNNLQLTGARIQRACACGGCASCAAKEDPQARLQTKPIVDLSERLVAQSDGARIQRACACGGSCPSCMQGQDTQRKLQTKLEISAPNDEYEQEADQVAEQVIQMNPGLAESDNNRPTVASTIQRIATKSSVQTQETSAIDLNPGEGQPLSPATRAFMEPRFGANFEHIRLHTDERSQQQAAQIHSRAFTYRHHIWLGQGESEQDKRLMAHELTHVVQQNPNNIFQTISPVIQRYSHQDCEEADLRNHIWPADWIAKQMVNKAIRVLSARPIDPAVTPLLSKYFMSNTPSIADILRVFRKIKDDFDGNSYQYECEYDCTDANAYVYGIWTDIHLCMNMLRGRANDCIASTIVHEFSHYSANTDDESGRCYDCGNFFGCPAALSTTDAVDNADSYAGFAYELYPMGV